jgi:hypothetical protein
MNPLLNVIEHISVEAQKLLSALDLETDADTVHALFHSLEVC